MRTTIFPMNHNMHLKPSFWGIERDLKSIIDDMEGVWDGTQQKQSSGNTHETEQAYMATLDIPGVSRANLEIQIEENHIRIEGQRNLQRLNEEKDNTAKITKFVSIPKNVDRDKIQAHHEDGVLYLALPKREKTPPTKIKISTGDREKVWGKLLNEKESNNN